MKKKSEDELFMDAVRQTRPRYIIPSMKTYKDRTKYDRNRDKEELRREVNAEEEEA